MKIINEKGKLFGIINVVDLMILILVIAVVAGVFWAMFGSSVTDMAIPEVEMSYEVRIRGINDFIYDDLDIEALIGKQLVSGNDFVPNSFIVSTELVEHYSSVTTADGEVISAKDPTKMDLLVGIVTSVPEGTPTPTVGSQEVRVGRTHFVKTNDFEIAGTVETVAFDG